MTALRTARSIAVETASASRRLPRGRLSKVSKIAASTTSSMPAPCARAARQAGDHHIGIARKIALGRQRERDRNDAGEGQAATLRDAFVARRQQDVAILVEPAVIDLADDARLAGRQQDDVAVERAHDFADALRARETRMFGQMHGFAMRGDGDFRPQPGVHLREFGAARMAGDMDKLRAVGDDFDALRDEAVDDLADRLLVARNGARGEDDDVAGRERRGRVLVFGDARERRARLALAARRQSQNLVARNAVEMILAEERRQAVEIAAFARHRDDALHRAADHHDLLAVGDPRLRRRAKARHIGGESRDDDAARRLADQRGKIGRDIGLRRALPFAQHIGRIADQRQHAFIAQRAAGALRRSACRRAAWRRSSSRRCARSARRACGSPERSFRESNARPE